MNQLGGSQSSVFLTNTLSANTFTNIFFISLSAGSWIIVGNAYFPSATTYSLLSISATTGQADNYSQVITPGNGNTCINVTRCITITSGNPTWFLVAQTGSALTISQSSFYAHRIG